MQKVADALGDDSLRSRQAYAKPVLRVYGSVGRLTQAGTGLNSEIMPNGMASMSPNQRA